MRKHFANPFGNTIFATVIQREAGKTASFFVKYRKMIDKNAVTELAEDYLQNTRNYLVDVQVVPGNIVTVEIDNDNGVNIDECVALSRYLESKLDRDTEDFELTVTSAGLTSHFKTLRQYKKYVGKEIETLTKKGEKLKGVLKEADENGFVITVFHMEKPEGAKRKTEVSYDLPFSYDEIKYTKYLIQFK